MRRSRYHRNKRFTFELHGNKRKINRILTEKRPISRYDQYGRRHTEMARLVDRKYYRIYYHKGQGYALYIGPNKESHGGLRHRPPRKGTSATYKMKKEKADVITQTKKDAKFKDYDKIMFGPHEGKYFDKRTHRILTKDQIETLAKQRGK